MTLIEARVFENCFNIYITRWIVYFLPSANLFDYCHVGVLGASDGSRAEALGWRSRPRAGMENKCLSCSPWTRQWNMAAIIFGREVVGRKETRRAEGGNYYLSLSGKYIESCQSIAAVRAVAGRIFKLQGWDLLHTFKPAVVVNLRSRCCNVSACSHSMIHCCRSRGVVSLRPLSLGERTNGRTNRTGAIDPGQGQGRGRGPLMCHRRANASLCRMEISLCGHCRTSDL